MPVLFFGAFELTFEMTAVVRMTILFTRVSGASGRLMGEGFPQNNSGTAILHWNHMN